MFELCSNKKHRFKKYIYPTWHRTCSYNFWFMMIVLVNPTWPSFHITLEIKVKNFEWQSKWMQHRDFPGGHPSQYYSGPKALNFRVLMGSGVVALVWPHHIHLRSSINLIHLSVHPSLICCASLSNDVVIILLCERQ